MNSCEPRLVVSLGFLVMTLTPLALTVLLPSLQQDSWRSARYLAVELCICSHQLLDGGSLMTIRAVTSLITGGGQFRHCVHYC